MPIISRSSRAEAEARPLCVLSLFARHGVEKYPEAYPALQEFYAAKLPGVEVTRIIVDNALPEGSRDRDASGATILGAPNASWEFSAWDAAIEGLRSSLVRYDYIHLVTSAWRQLYTGYVDRIDAGSLRALRGRDAVLGHVDAYREPVAILGRTSRAWLRSSFLFIPFAVLKRLGPLTSLDAEAREFFSGDPRAPFRDDAPISEAFRRNIVDWLTGPASHWHSRFDLDAETLSFFEAKARAIINEHLLTLRLLAQGTGVVDSTWLSARLARRNGVNPDSVADWRRQLVERVPFI